MSPDENHCMALVREADRDRYLAALYAPEHKRGALFALYAFNTEIARIRDVIRDPLPGEIRLQWWRDVIEDRTGAAAAGHPVASSLHGAIEAHGLPRAAFQNYLEARIFDLYDDPMPDRPALEGYCGETASALIQLSALILDPQAAPRFSDLAGHAGCAQGIAGLLLLLPIHRARGQCYIPADILAAAGSSCAELIEGGAAANNAVAAMIALAREHFSAFERGAPALPASLRPAFLPLALTPALLDRLARAADPLRDIADLSELRRQWLLFRHARRGWK